MKQFIRLTLLSMGLLCAVVGAKAQQVTPGAFGYYSDALRYSQTNNLGSARLAGLAGSGMALGGDIGSIGLNPAGLGLFNRSQFVITPGISLNTSDNLFLGNNINTEESNFDLANFGLVINFESGSGAWKSGSLGITYNRVNDFRQNFFFRGQNPNNSIIDAMLEQANGFFPEELGGLAQVGFDHYLINPIPGAEDNYDSFVLGFPEQVETIRTTGATDEIRIAYGTNFEDKIFLGGGIGIVTTNYTYSRIFTENFTGEPLSSFTIDERLDVNGTGVNVNLGVIFRPTDFVRLGATYTSPTWYSFSEESDIFYNSEYNNYDVANFVDDFGNRIIQEDTVLNSLNSNTDLFFSDFTLRTPSKFTAGAAFFLNKSGFITADIEYLDYSNSHVSSRDFFEDADNQTINNIYQSVTNIKLGAEYRYKLFRFRAGYSRLGDPFQDGFDDLDRTRTIIAAGVGLNFGKYFFDLAYTNTSFEQSFAPYTLADGANPVAIADNSLNQTRISFGLNF